MLDLETRDLVVLYVICTWNQHEATRMKQYSPMQRPSMSRPCTITVLCGRHEPDGGIVNKFIKDHLMNIELADDSEQVYRSIRKLVAARLVIASQSNRKSYAQTESGQKLFNVLSSDPANWPTKVEIDGNSINIRPALHAR